MTSLEARERGLRQLATAKSVVFDWPGHLLVTRQPLAGGDGVCVLVKGDEVGSVEFLRDLTKEWSPLSDYQKVFYQTDWVAWRFPNRNIARLYVYSATEAGKDTFVAMLDAWWQAALAT